MIALIQLIPPIIVRRFLEQNCEDTQNIETEITNVILEAYHGFAVLKLYKLKDWYLKRLSGLNKKERSNQLLSVLVITQNSPEVSQRQI